MLISDTYKLILMLPEKCATSTTELRFAEIKDLRSSASYPEYERVLKKRISKHLMLKDALRLEDFHQREGHLKACFVRNPYDRIYSLFSWIVKKSKNDMELVESKQPIRGVSPDETKKYAKKVKRIVSRYEKLKKTNFDFNSNLPRKAKRFRKISLYTHHKGIAHMDFIGRVETFEQDFSELCQKIDFLPKSQKNTNVINQETLAERASTSEPIFLPKYTPKSIKLVNRICAEDFINFGYKQYSPTEALLK